MIGVEGREVVVMVGGGRGGRGGVGQKLKKVRISKYGCGSRLGLLTFGLGYMAYLGSTYET